MKIRVHSFKYIVSILLVALVAVLGCGGVTFADEAESGPAVITIVAGGKNFTYVDEKITPSDFTVGEEIEARRINASLQDKLELVDKYLSRGADYAAALNACFPLLERTVDAVAEHLYVGSVNAEAVKSGRSYTVTKHRNGVALDETRLYAGIYYSLKYSGGGSVTAPTKILTPAVTSSTVYEELNVRGSYSTDYKASTASRAHNVALAISKLDGLTIAPNESVSFNKAVGARTEENGFESAKIIVDGQYVDGVGGGVCQASTAFYNAALLAGLNCSANAHSICPSYCPPGLDAMISNVSDLVVTNTTGRTVRISAYSDGYSSTVKIYGIKNEYKIEPESVVVKCIKFEQIEKNDTERKYFDSNAVSGDRQLVAVGKDGYISETYLNYYKNGELVKRVRIRSNEYRAVPQVIAVAP